MISIEDMDVHRIKLPKEFREEHQKKLERGDFDSVMKHQRGGVKHGKVVTIAYMLMEDSEVEGTLGSKNPDLLDEENNVVLEARLELDKDYIEDRAKELVPELLEINSSIDRWDIGLVTANYELYLLKLQKITMDRTGSMNFSSISGQLRKRVKNRKGRKKSKEAVNQLKDVDW